MKKVLIPTKLDTIAADLLKEKGYDVVQSTDESLEELVKAHANTEVLIVRSEKVTSEIIDALPELKLVVRAGAGYNTIDIKYARRKNIAVMNTPGANSNAVAEEVIAMMLADARHIVKGDITTRDGEWLKSKLMGKELTGKTIGIMGLGNIGRLLIKRLQGFDMTFMGFDPFISAELADTLGVKLASIEEIFEECDYISLHIPENDETRGSINKKLFDKMKDGATLINCARAGVINEDDLREVKKEKDIRYLNDVYPKDAPGEKTIADVADLMLPHLGASTKEANFTAAKRSAEQTINFFDKGITDCVVNKDVPDGLDKKYQSLAFALASLGKAYLGGAAPYEIATSYYGELNKYEKWMLPPIIAAMSSAADPYFDAASAKEFIEERGINVTNRDINSEKQYGEAMTIDLLEGSGNTINKVSVRGTIAENNLMISRINKFDKLYLEPTGHNLFVEYKDEPGTIGKIASILGKKNINILDIRAPQDLSLNISLAIVKTNVPVTAEVISEIKETVKASKAFTFNC
jgi:D-3-phosphoglycerate dehydrogenase